MLNFRHIKSVEFRELTKNPNVIVKFKTRFWLHCTEPPTLNDEETVIGEENGKILVEGNYFNSFIAVQRILSLGSKCTVEDPPEFRNEIISKLKEMRKLYEEEK